MKLNHLVTKVLLLNESLLDVRRKNAQNLSDEEFESLLKYDPLLYDISNADETTMKASPESYIRWLLKMNKSGQLSHSSPENVRNLLKSFEQLKKRRTVLPNNDINSYKSVDELKNTIEANSHNLTTNQMNKDAKRNQAKISGEKQPGMYMDGAVELLFNGNNWELWTPHTYEGSKALRRGASWCTGGDTPNYYNNYTQDGQLFVFINKKDPAEKYQLFVPDGGDQSVRTREFRDAHNESVRFRNFVHENSELLEPVLNIDIINDSYENLEDPYIDDEWDEDREWEIMEDYGLSYTDMGELAVSIDYDDLVNRTYYTDYRDYQAMASEGYNDAHYSDFAAFKRDVLRTKYIITDVNWGETDLGILYKYYLYDSKRKEEDIPFNHFIYTLLNGASNETEMIDHDSELYNWFNIKGGNGWEKKVFNCIDEMYLCDPIDNYIYEQLQKCGWNPPRPSYSWRSDNSYENYLNNFKEHFVSILDDYHSVQDFWENAVDRGNISPERFLKDYDIQINEVEGDIDPDNANFSDYESDYADDNATDICKVFVDPVEMHTFEDEEPEADKLSVKESGNMLFFSKDGIVFYGLAEKFKWVETRYKINGVLDMDTLAYDLVKQIDKNYSQENIKDFLSANDFDVPNRELTREEYWDALEKVVEKLVQEYFDNKKDDENEDLDESLFDTDW